MTRYLEGRETSRFYCTAVMDPSQGNVWQLRGTSIVEMLTTLLSQCVAVRDVKFMEILNCGKKQKKTGKE
jgi:hypothetical protein